MFRSIIIVIAIGISSLLQAQNDVEALRWSMQDLTGTARYVGVSGAFNALGADITTLSTNPAGLGVYRHSEVVGTAGIYGNAYDASYFNNNTTSGNAYGYLPNFGLVISGERKNSAGRKKVNGWKRTNFGIGLNRISNYRSELQYEGINPFNSLMEKYVEDLSSGGGTNPSNAYSSYPYGAGLAYDTYMIDPIPDDTTSYTSNIPFGGALQRKNIEARGRMNEWDISFAGNYNDKLFVGATLGIPTLKYSDEVTFREEDVQDSIDYFENYNYTTTLTTEATGVNLKVGLIYWVNDYIRVGGAIHTPSILGFEDQFYAEMNSDLENDSTYASSTPSGNFSYSLITPWRTLASVAVMLGQNGFISAEYEYYNPGSTRFWFNDGGSESYESELNNNIKTKYGGVNILKVGAEVALEDLRLRGGIRYSTTVFKDNQVPDENGDHQQFGYSLGAGYMYKWFFVDVAFQQVFTDFADVPYTLQDPNKTVGGALVDHTKYNAIVTAGLKF